MLCLLSSGFVPRARRRLAAGFRPASGTFPQARHHFERKDLEPLDNRDATKQFMFSGPNNNCFKILCKNQIVIRDCDSHITLRAGDGERPSYLNR
jgi:hypothetical protein